jgi:hypothetical protein
VASALILIVPGCFVSPRPEPPQATFDPDLVSGVYGWGVTLTGAAGAAAPAGAVIRGTNLEDDSAPAEAVIQGDGSFELELNAEFGHEVRFQVIADGSRSAPLDAVVEEGGTLRPGPRPLADCLSLDPAAELDLADELTVTVSNGCGEAVTLEAPRLRRSDAAVELGADLTWPLVLARGEEVSVLVGAAELDDEAIFFIETSAPERDRRPITMVPP